ncbi:MAG: YicC family protein [Planctomycetota bacterium]|nr:YicC family protein [Planctomycetota bacterium]
MLLSMTGYGEARRHDPRWTIEVEARTVNNRHFKLSARISEPYSTLEGDIERLARESIRRGTVQLSVRVDRPKRPDDYRLNMTALQSYQRQFGEIFGGSAVDPSALLGLPGVVEERRAEAADPRDDWPELAAVVSEALAKLQASRLAEGGAMAVELTALASLMSTRLELVAARAPEVVTAYQTRLFERVRTLMKDQGSVLEPRDLAREVAILADRADIAEEVVRLRTHLERFREALDEPESPGRKLDFLVQEIGRETNTIGSKANDLEITRHVVEMKGILEKIRELIQNVE